MPELDLNLWLRPEDVEPESVITFIDAGERGLIAGKPSEEDIETFEIGVILPNGEKRIWTMNKSSQRAVAQTYGIKTEEWINKPVTVYVSKQNVRGTEKKVIYARVPEKIEEQV